MYKFTTPSKKKKVFVKKKKFSSKHIFVDQLIMVCKQYIDTQWWPIACLCWITLRLFYLIQLSMFSDRPFVSEERFSESPSDDIYHCIPGATLRAQTVHGYLYSSLQNRSSLTTSVALWVNFTRFCFSAKYRQQTSHS